MPNYEARIEQSKNDHMQLIASNLLIPQWMVASDYSRTIPFCLNVEDGMAINFEWLSETNQDRLEKLVEQFAKEVTEAMVKLDTEVQKLKEEKK